MQGLNLICAGEPLVSKSKSKKYPAGSKRTAAGFFIQTLSRTSAKIKYLKTISAKLKIKLTILPPETAQNDELPGFNFTPADDETLTGVSWLIPANGKLYNHEAASINSAISTGSRINIITGKVILFIFTAPVPLAKSVI